jgi:hypothetical protein
MQPRQRHALAEAFGGLTATIFKSGVFQNDYSLNNFIGQHPDQGGRLFFIDFERVFAGAAISLEDKLLLLAKLNRVGRQVAVTDRLRFLRGYRAVDSGMGGSLNESARAVYEKFIEVIRRDVQRGRMTSLYTHGEYERVRLRGYNGLCQKDVDCHKLLNRLPSPAGLPAAGILNLPVREKKDVKVFCYAGTADRVRFLWTVISTCVIAGAPCALPRAVVCKDRNGWLLLASSDRQVLLELESHSRRVGAFMKKHFDREYKEMHEALLWA